MEVSENPLPTPFFDVIGSDCGVRLILYFCHPNNSDQSSKNNKK
jgi:hypothetical protein